MSAILDMGQVALHPNVVGHNPDACPTCQRQERERQHAEASTFMARCAGECGSMTPHLATGATSAECQMCGTERWV